MSNCEGNVYHIGMGCCVPKIVNPDLYYTKEEVDEKIDDIEVSGATEERVGEMIDESLQGYATEEWVNDQGFLKEHQLLDNYYSKSETDGLVSDLEASDSVISGAVDNLSSDLATEAQRAISSEQALGGKIDTVSGNLQTQIQTIENELQGDYASKEWVSGFTYDKTATDALLAAKANTATTYTKTNVNNLLAKKADTATTYTKDDVDIFINTLETADSVLDGRVNRLDANLETETQRAQNAEAAISGAIPSLDGYATKAFVSGYTYDKTTIEDMIEEGGGGTVTVDSALSETSENPVQNKVITSNLAFKKTVNPSDSSKVGLVNSLSQYYDTNIGKGAVIEGEGTSTAKITASGYYSHAEGYRTTASAIYSHAEGNNTTASGIYSHAEGYQTTASGNTSHAEGYGTKATNIYSHAEGFGTTASGDYSHAEGYETIANNQSEHASGQYNVSSSASTTFGNGGNTLFSVGNGTNANNRHNAFEIRQNGDIYITKDNTDVKLQGALDNLDDDIINLENTFVERIKVPSTISTSANSNYMTLNIPYLYGWDNDISYETNEVEFSAATSGSSGVMSAEDKTKLDGLLKTWSGTRAQYDALTNKDSNTIYFIYNE